MKYCVTGGSGFIGSFCCEALRARGDGIVILDLIDPPAGTPHDRFVRGDIRDAAACRSALPGCDRVLHLAAAHHDFGITEDTYYSVNERGTQVLLDAMDEAGVRDICFYSTVALYGTAPPPLHEGVEGRPNSPYGGSKLAGEKICRSWTERGGGRRCLVIRPTVTFGPRNFANMYSLIRQVHSGKFAFVGPGTNIKSLSYVENIVDATFFLMDRSDLPAFDVYNYVEKPDLTSRQIAEVVYRCLDRTPTRLTIPKWLAFLAAMPFDIAIALTGKNIPVSSARIRKLFTDETKFEADRVRERGFTPRVPLDEGIRRMVAWYLQEGRTQRAEWHQPPAEVIRFDGE